MKRVAIPSEVVKEIVFMALDEVAKDFGGYVNIGNDGFKYILELCFEKTEKIVFERVTDDGKKISSSSDHRDDL